MITGPLDIIIPLLIFLAWIAIWASFFLARKQREIALKIRLQDDRLVDMPEKEKDYEKLLDWKEQTFAGIIFDAGNSRFYHTGSWRTFRPVWAADKCIHCLRCFYLCPDSAITVEDAKVQGIDLLRTGAVVQKNRRYIYTV